MAELRVDPLTGQRVIVAAARVNGPGRGLSALALAPLDPERDPLAEGHEDRTPPELYALRPGGGGADTPGWTVRVLPSLDSALDGGSAEPLPAPEANPDLFWSARAVGAHEVIVSSPAAVTSLAELSVDEVCAAVEVWRLRMRAHSDATYPHLTVNERAEAGASLAHSHAQLYALDFVPAAIARERERFGAYAARTMGANLLADLVQEEVRRRERIVAIDDDAVLMAPFGSRMPYQLMLAPRTPRMRFEDDGPTGAALLHEALSRLAGHLGASPPLNLWVRTAPRDADQFCWRIDILPRLTHLAGLELGAGVHLNIVAPEQAAAELRKV